MVHVALGIEYDGSAFHGWQRQPGVASVQAVLETALSGIADQPVRLVASGRTDAGVHATGQVVSFKTEVRRPLDAWIRGTNSLTPPSVTVHWAREVADGFHARFSALARRYLYVLLESPQRPAILRSQVTWSRHPLDDDSMHGAAQSLVGEHDFTSFRAAGCQSRSPFRCVHTIAVRRFGSFVAIDVTANAFLHHMVRNIASALTQVGRGERAQTWLAELLLARRRELTGPTARPDGLYLFEVRYPAEFSLPSGLPPPMLRGCGDIW